jgi:hypothetical protein
MTSLLNFFDKNSDGIVDTNNWGSLGVSFSGGGSPGPQEPTGPTGPAGPGSYELVFSNVGDSYIGAVEVSYLGRCKNTGSIGEAIVMLRPEIVTSIFASSYSQSPASGQNRVYNLFKNGLHQQ